MSLLTFLVSRADQCCSILAYRRKPEFADGGGSDRSLNSLVSPLAEVRNEPGFQRTTRSAGRAGVLVVRVALETV